jgi:hypothetical protein
MTILHAQGLQSMPFHSSTLTLFCIVLCFAHVKLWLCELSKLFFYICGEFMIQKLQLNIMNLIGKVYYAYFGVKLGDQDHGLHTRYIMFV